MSSLKERIASDLKTAMLARDEFAKITLSGLKAAILNEEVAKGEREAGLSDEAIEQLIAREVKKRNEAAELFDQGGNTASADKERNERKILEMYLPQQLSEAEITSIVDEVIQERGATSMADMGAVIGAVKARVGNTADGAIIAALVKAKLA